MTTFKQLDAFVAVADMGSFDGAGRRLGIAQSAVSKHVLEFEAGFPKPLLDRSKRRAALTVDGAEVLMRCRTLLARRDAMLNALSTQELPVKKLRIGVTEVIALTWLHKFLDALRNECPHVEVELKVEVSVRLREELRAGDVDLVVVPDAARTHGLFRAELGRLDNQWYCSPAIHPGRKVLRPEDLAQFDLLTQGGLSRSGTVLEDWLRQNGIAPRSIISSSSLLAMIDLMVAGLGISHLPAVLVREFIRRGLVREVHLKPTMPAVVYVLLFKEIGSTPLHRRVVRIAEAACNFGIASTDSIVSGASLKRRPRP